MYRIITCSNQIRKIGLRQSETLHVVRIKYNCNWLSSSIMQSMCSSGESSNAQADKNVLDMQITINNKLSPTSRVLDMLSEERNSEVDLKNSNEHTVFNEKTDNRVKQTSINPIKYNPCNPRSAKNMSYLDNSSQINENTANRPSGRAYDKQNLKNKYQTNLYN